MSPTWALSLPASQVRALGALRLWPAIELHDAGDLLWLRAPRLDDELGEHCRQLPGAVRFTVQADGQLVAAGTIVPRDVLPAGPWQPLAQWLRVDVPLAALPGHRPAPVPVTLVRAGEPGEASWLVTTAELWAAYAATAPQVRLARWSWAAGARGRVAIRGTPLPPLPGERLVEHEGIAVPAGWTWTPAVPAGVLRRALQLGEGDCALWAADGSWCPIPASGWMRAARSAVRLTCLELDRGA